MTKIRFLLFIILLTSLQTFGQNIKGNTGIDDTHKPNGSSGGTGKDMVNVDLFTGTAAINVPIYSYNIDGVDGSVSLGYTAKGIQVDQIASSVGLGWDLQAGGYISREVNGLEDEVTLPISFVGANADSLQGYMVPGATISQNNVTPKDDDKEQDLFHFVFGGRSLDVVFKRQSNGNYTWQTYPKSEIKIEILTKDSATTGPDIYTNFNSDIGRKCGLSPAINMVTFIVTDEHGNHFQFEKGDYAYKEYKFYDWSLLDTTRGVYYPIEKWNLTRVITHGGHVINYDYEYRWMDYVETLKEEVKPLPEKYSSTDLTYDPFERQEVHWKGVRSHIKKITYPNGITATFNLNSVTRCDCPGNFYLRNIEIAETYDNNVKGKLTYNLEYNFFRSAGFGFSASQILSFVAGTCNTLTASLTIPSGMNVDSAKEAYRTRALRMKLSFIRRTGTDNNSSEVYYTFDYDSTPLPFRLDHHKDFYGYYNGNKTDYPHLRHNLLDYNIIDTIYTSIPYPAYADHTYYNPASTALNSSSPFGYDRSYSATYAKAWTLNSVTNGLGGTNKIYYQDYTLSNPDSSYGNLGTRTEGYANTPIYTTIDPALQGSDVNDGLCIWKVEHKDNFNSENATITEYTFSDGIRFHRGGYCWYLDVLSSPSYNVYTNYFLSPFKYVHGSNHGFSTVTVTQKGITNSYQLGKTVYSFSNLIYTDANGHPQSWMQKPTGSAWHTAPADMKIYKMGLPLSVQQYDENNNLTAKTVNFFDDAVTTTDSIKNWRFFDGYAWKYLLLDYQRARLVKTATAKYVYDPDASVTKTVADTATYSFDNNDNVTCSVSKNSKKETIKEYTKYNYDFSSLYSSNDALDKLGTNSIQTPLVSQTWKMGINDSSLLSMEIASPSTNLPNYIYYVGADIPAISSLRFDAGFVTKLKAPLSSANAASTSYINIPLAIANNSSAGSALLRIRQVSRYDDNFNVIEEKYNNRDKYVSYLWDQRSYKKLAEVQNARFDDIAFTSFEGQYDAPPAGDYDRGNWDFEPGSVQYYVDAFLNNAVTGKYVYELEDGISDVRSKPLRHMKYNLSFWKKEAANACIAVERLDANNNSMGMVSLTETNTVGDWKLFTASFTPDSGEHITIFEPLCTTGGTTYIDEVRLHPAEASMTSYAYYPLFGPASQTNPDNYISYFDYDVMGRYSGQRDMRGNIIKKYETSYDLANTDDGNVVKPSATNNPNQPTQ